MNVLLPQIKDNPERKMAAPAFNRKVEKEINKKAGNVGPDPRLFLDLGDSISFEQVDERFLWQSVLKAYYNVLECFEHQSPIVCQKGKTSVRRI